MTAIHDDEPRDVVPRWHDFGSAVRRGELSPASPRPPRAALQSADVLGDASRALEAAPGLYTAGELVSHATVVGSREPAAVRAAHYILASDASDSLRDIAIALVEERPSTRAISEPSPFSWEATVRRVQKLKRILQKEPRNAIRWTDLALAHLNLGATAAARRDILTALTLAPSNRYVLRSAVRLFILQDDPETAHRFLVFDRDALNDPWILAAELATTELMGKSPTSIRKTRHIITSGAYSPWHTSELASQLATMELRAGHLKQAKKTMRRALVDPTENSVAQAEWAANHGIDPPSDSALELPGSFEARALAAAQVGDISAAVEDGTKWQADQPFDPGPATFVSYMATIGLEDYERGEQAAKQGLIANPTNGTIRNNLVFSLASQGKVVEASEQLRQIQPPDGGKETATLTATRGLVAFRSGDEVLGRALYKEARDLLLSVKEADVAALATLMWAREELHASTPEAPRVVREAVDMARRSPAAEVRIWLRRIAESARAVTLSGAETRL